MSLRPKKDAIPKHLRTKDDFRLSKIKDPTERKKVFFVKQRSKFNKRKEQLEKHLSRELGEKVKMELIKSERGYPRIRVVTYVLDEDDVYIVESQVHAVIERNFGHIKSVWEPGLVDEGWEFNYILKPYTS